MTVDATTRSIVFNTGDYSLVPLPATELAHNIDITVKTPSGRAITGNPTSIVVVTMKSDTVCNPPSTVTASTPPTDNTFKFGDAAKTIVFDAWTYATDPVGSTCALSYVATIPADA
jgi:hypothetical protein